MKKLLFFPILFTILAGPTACSQEQAGQETTVSPRAAILAEGIMLYQLEITSWKSSEILREQQPDLMTQVGGYFSYPMAESGFKTVFISEANPALITAEIEFADLYHDEPARSAYVARPPTALEQEYLALRNDALERTADESFFTYYDNTANNLVPVIQEGEKRVYLLTSSKMPDYFIFGNDYLLTYDPAGKFLKREKLHQDFVTLKAQAEAVNGVVGTSHTHSGDSSEYITATDICNLLLYGEYTNWQQHYVVSESHISIWDLQKQDLVIMTTAEWKSGLSKDDE